MGQHGVPDLPLMLRCLADRPSLEASRPRVRAPTARPRPSRVAWRSHLRVRADAVHASVKTAVVLVDVVFSVSLLRRVWRLRVALEAPGCNAAPHAPPSCRSTRARQGFRSIRPRASAKSGDVDSRLRRKINPTTMNISPPAPAEPTMPPFRHRMHRVMRTRRGGAGAGGGSDRRLSFPGRDQGLPR